MTLPRQPIGEINGVFAVLLKVTLVAFPLFVPMVMAWGVWTTSSIYELQATDRLMHQTSAQIAVNTPRITATEKLLAELVEWKRHAEAMLEQNQKQHAAISEQLTKMEAVLTEVRIMLAKKSNE